MLSFIKQIWKYVKARRKFWLLPLFAVMAVLAALLVLGQGSAVAPFIYTLF